MNRQIIKLFAFTMALFAVLIAFTSYWSVFDAEALKEEEANKRPLIAQQKIERGRILTADGEVIARSVRKGRGSSYAYVRRYPQGSVFGHPIGYSYVSKGDTEFEQYHNDELIGEGSEFSSILDELLGRQQQGNDVVTNIDSGAQRIALAGLDATGFGAVVAIEPKTGRVRVMASKPGYDPNEIPNDKRFTELSLNEFESPLYDRASQGQYPPGSTFKVVTAAAGLESGAITPETTIEAPSPMTFETKPLQNDFNDSFGPISLATALTNSVNTWFAQLGVKVGNETLFRQMEAFGFNSKPPIDLPSDAVLSSGVFGEDGLLRAGDPVDLARVAIGQERLLVTPLQNAMVAAAIANKGKLMRPQIWSRVVDPDGRVVDKLDPSEYKQSVSPETAAELTTAMEGVVDEGTGTAARIAGIPVAGKTGTAETPGFESCAGVADPNQAWFIGFAPADDPEIAIAVTVECTEEFGGTAAAPIFHDVAEALLGGE
ncbi:MAG: penicillin-binding transpeptidase domain-containing protein [Solirubrobacterales bacterium]